jgi:hypothetical protein
VKTTKNTSRRRSTRGAALVEALVVIPTLVLVTLGLLAINSAHAKRNQVLREADAKVWPKALPGCGSGGDDTSLSRVDGKLSEAKQMATGQTLREPLETGIETIQDSAQLRSMDARELMGVSVSSDAKVSCNEKGGAISRGDVDTVARKFFSEFM